MKHALASRAVSVPDQPAYLLGEDSFFWERRGAGVISWGEVERIEVGSGADRFSLAQRQLTGSFASWDMPSDVPFRPIAFGSFTFDEDVDGSFLTIPERILRWGPEGAFLLSLSGDLEMPDPHPRTPLPEVRYGRSSLPDHVWLDRVSRAKNLIAGTDLEKVVLARDVRIWAKTHLEHRPILERLARDFPDCYTFSAGGLIGSTPELLLRKRGDEVFSLVLAGTVGRGDGREDQRLGEGLLESVKDRREHDLAVASVTEVLGPLCGSLDIDGPQLLRLANVQHLATRVRGTLAQDAGALELTGALHPTAAVCGTPRTRAGEVIDELEELDRGRYAGPVGWVDAAGNGEWAIALRCAELDGNRGRLFAGAGILADSQPQAELEETRLKLRAMMQVLSPGASNGQP